MVEVFEDTAVPGLRTASIFLYSACLMSRRSTTASTIQSLSASCARWSSMLPGVTSLAARADMKGAGSVFSILAMAPSAKALRLAAPSGTMSSSSTGMPALAN
jgi:hypothetical protein